MKNNGTMKRQLNALESAGRLRNLVTITAGNGSYAIVEGRRFLNLCSNDYLDLVNDERLKRAICESIAKWGVGSGASRLLSGNLSLHEKLENKAANLVRMDAALAFSSGYCANIGLLSSISGPGDVIFSDELNHASIIDGCSLSKGDTVVYKHADFMDLKKKIKTYLRNDRKIYIVTESYFSMNGDFAPLVELAAIAGDSGAELIVDEAHAIGVWGGGRGVCHKLGITNLVSALIGTLGKALGNQGAFVAGSNTLRKFLINKARSFIYSTALAPACASGAIKAIEIVEESGPDMEEKLLTKSAAFRDLLNKAGIPVFEQSLGPIVPVVFGKEELAVNAAEYLLEKGYLARPIRPPTVPEGTSRLRFSITRGHKIEDLENLAKILRKFSDSEEKPR